VSYQVTPNTAVVRSGVITVAGQSFTVTQAGAGPATPLVFTVSSVLPNASVGGGYSTLIGVGGGSPPYRWTPVSGLPAGLALDANTGVLSGTPTATGTHNLLITVTDAAGVSVQQNFVLTVSATPSGGGSTSLAITTSQLPQGVTGAAYQQPVATSGGCVNPFSGPPQITLASGTLPPGLSIQTLPTGHYGIAGTPTTQGTYTFVLRATACAESVTRSFTIVIAQGTGSTSQITATPPSLAFSVLPDQPRPADQSVRIATPQPGVPFSVTASTVSGGNWLAVSTTAAVTPVDLVVGLAPGYSSLGPGTYQGKVTIVSQTAGSLEIPVTLTVGGVAPVIDVSTTQLLFDHVPGSVTFSEQNVAVTSAVTAAFTATAAGGSWLSVVPGSGQTPANLRIIVNSAALAPGNYEGTVTVTPAGNPTAARVIRVVLRIASVSLPVPSAATLGFTHAGVGTPAAQALTVTSTGAPITFVTTATTQTGSNWLMVTPSAGLTPATLSVSVNPAGLPPGVHAGTIAIRGGASPVPAVVQVQLVVSALSPVIRSVENGASFRPGPIAPGEIVTIKGENLGPATLATYRLTAAGTLDTSVAGTRVLFDGTPAPILHTSGAQVTVVVPYALAGRATARVVLEYQGATSQPVDVAVSEAAPGIFTLGGTAQAAMVNQDLTINSAANPAPAGSIVSLYATGEGQTIPAGVEGTLTPLDSLPLPVLPVRVLIGGIEAQVTYSGAAPGQPAGLVQVNARVPESTAAAPNVTVVLIVGSSASEPVTMHVR
jgi:uncharacterized protein (TIGR03437 family)